MNSCARGEFAMKCREDLEVICIRTSHSNLLNQFTSILWILNERERKVYERYVVDSKKVEFLIGRAIAKWWIAKRHNLLIDDIGFEKTRFGKPYVDYSNLKLIRESAYFNISHTKGLVCVLVSSQENIGIDVEWLGREYLDVISLVFQREEKKFIDDLDIIDDKIRHFHKIWTKKEAIVKVQGLGLYKSPNSISVPLGIGKTTKDDYIIKSISFLKEYIISIAVENKESKKIKLKTQEIKWESLIKEIQFKN